MPAPTVLSYITGLPQIFNPWAYIHQTNPTRKLLHGFNGTLEPGELLMVIGKPGSGCTTFLKALSNQREEYHTIAGDIEFGMWSPTEIQKHHANELTFCGNNLHAHTSKHKANADFCTAEEDIHFPTLTVKDTLSYVHEFQGWAPY